MNLIKGPNHVTIENGVLKIIDFIETDPDVVEVIGGADDADVALHQCLGIGARASRLVKTTVDTEVVHNAFDSMTSTFDRTVTEAVELFHDTVSRVFVGEDAEVRTALSSWQTEVGELFDGIFDEESKKSVLGKLDTILAKAAENELNAFRRLIDPDNDASPMARWRSGIERTVKDQVGTVLSVVVELSEKVAASKAEAQIFELTTQKGFSYEDQVHSVVSQAAAAYGDMAEQVGKTTGSDGNQAGDELVTLNEVDTFGKCGRYVLEIKDTRLSTAKTLEEVDRAISNRGALAGIAVFSKQANAPTAAPFHYLGNRAIVVLDKTETDDKALKLALLWARWVVRRQLNEQVEGLDLNRVEALIDEGRTALKRVSTIRRCLSAGKKQIEDAAINVNGLFDEIEGVLDALTKEVA